ncbi:MAG: sulfite exporter TauE/SafE family protein [Bdellovibrionaceae bacterium]|nr:sulfite exporter TauE/SafE family protein [Pseudobdellovibrionaceae bacterium]
MGLSLGLIGGGGSILTVPILVYFFNLDGISATTDSLFVVGATALFGAALNIKRKLVDFKTGILFAVPSFFGVFVARRFILPFIPDQISLPMDLVVTKSILILASFSILMILAARSMIQSGKYKKQSIVLGEGYNFNIVIKGFLVGCTTGFVGAGGGFLIIPALVLLLNLSMRVAVGTSLAIIAANSLFGFFISINEDLVVNWQLLITVTLLGFLGLFVGYIFSPYVKEHRLKQGFGFFVLLVGLFILGDQILRLTA